MTKNHFEKHLASTLAVSAVFLLGSAPLTNAVAQTDSANGTMTSGAGQSVTDSWITTKIKSQLATTDGIKSTDISVTTVDGLVTLTGVLPTKIAVKKAVAVARATKGVKKVDASGLKSSE